MDKKSILKVLNSLFEEPNIFFESEQAVWRSLNYFRNAKPIKSGGKRKAAEFSDALIVNKARYVADKKDSIFAGAYTFDIAAQQIPGTKKP